MDRDFAIPLHGYKHAVSDIKKQESRIILKDPEQSAAIRGTIDSFASLIPFLISEKLPTAFYHEARSLQILMRTDSNLAKTLNQPYFEHGLHGYDHEDLPGEETGENFSREEEKEILYNGKKIIESLLSSEVHGFRAPYMRLSPNTLEILSELDFRYDSSVYKESDKGITPYKAHNNILEFPVIKTPKESSMRGMYTYLWPLFEGKRPKNEVIKNYLQLLNNSEEENSFISINLHSWHFAYLISEKRYLEEKEIERNIEIFRELILAVKDQVAVISTPIQWMKENQFF